MKKLIHFTLPLLLILPASTVYAQASPQTMQSLGAAIPWGDNELLEPSVLAAQISSDKAPVIFNIGAVEDIKNAIHIGPVEKADNLEKFKKQIASVPKSAAIVIYCGCCPFARCPNIRPAYKVLKEAGFSNISVLNLTQNLKTNWIAKGYPLAAQ